MVKRITNLVANAQRQAHIRRHADVQWRFHSFGVATEAHSCENFHTFKNSMFVFIEWYVASVFVMHLFRDITTYTSHANHNYFPSKLSR